VSRAVSRLLRDLTGRSEHDLIDLLHDQIATALRGGEYARHALLQDVPAPELRERMSEIEHDGDKGRGLLVTQLTRALTTPVDREDLFRLSRSIDDVLDHLRDFTRELDLYDVEERDIFLPLVDALISGLSELKIAVTAIVTDRSATARLCLAAKKSGNRVRRMYQEQLAAVFAGEFSMAAMKHKELLRRLDIAGLRLGEAADALADGAMKRSR
jgi:uncharacterized protein Yka (UPF0111/DUF47 family)